MVVVAIVAIVAIVVVEMVAIEADDQKDVPIIIATAKQDRNLHVQKETNLNQERHLLNQKMLKHGSIRPTKRF